MTQGIVQRRGVPQAEAVAERFGQGSLGAPTELLAGILPVAKVTRVDQPAMGGVEVGALAANRSMIQLFNPAGSNTDLLLKRLWISSGATGTVNLRTHDTALTNVSAFTASMIRLEGSNQIAPIGQIRSVQATAVGATMAFYRVITDVVLEINFILGDGEEFDGFVIQPGRGLLVAPGSDEQVMRATWEWLERQTG